MSKPFYPPLFAIFPVLALYAHNAGELTLSELWMPLGAAFGLGLAVLLIVWVPLRNVRKAGIVAILLIAPFFCYGYAKDVLTELGWPNHPAYLVGTWVTAFAIGTYLVVRTQKNLRGLTTVLNLAVVAIVAFPAVSIGIYESSRPTWSLETSPIIPETQAYERPDIYYIILDMYPRADVLEEHYGFDNSEFIDYLEGRGFYVPTSNLINHGPSSHSMASSLNMEYLTYLADELGEGETDMGPIYSLLQINKVSRFLTKWQGYRYVHMGSQWEMTRTSPLAHDNISPDTVSEFPLLVAQTTALRDIGGIDAIDYRKRHADYALAQFEGLMAIPDVEEPLFVFAHIVIPHGPYVFDQEGNYLTEQGSDQFIGQLEFCNKKVMELVDSILDENERAVIVLQGDTGAGCEGVEDCEAWKCSGEPSALFSELAAKNFVAYHLPAGSEMLYDTITPVNTFRVIFNAYFGMEYEMLESRQYLSSYKEPYYFIDVTEIAQGGAE